VAEDIARKHGVAVPSEAELVKGKADAALMEKKGRLTPPQKVPVLPLAERKGFEEVLKPLGPDAAVEEASRCLDCDELCSLCVTVCPNRANHAYEVAPFSREVPLLVQRQGRLVPEGTRTFRVDQRVQTLNVADFCNECGNCDTFCPTAGAPYKDKPRFWMDEQGYAEAKGDAFRLLKKHSGLALEAKLGGKEHHLELDGDLAWYRGPQVSARFDAKSWALLDWECPAVLPEGTEVDLRPALTLAMLFEARTAIPTAAQWVR
jgi:putative selenate reductase